MGKFNLKKVLLRKTQLEIIEGFSKWMDLSFKILEGDEVIYSSSENLEGLKHCFFLDISQDDLKVSVCMDKEEKSFIKMIEYFINSEIEKKVLANEILSKYKELNIFYSLSEKMSESLDINQIAEVAIKEARKDIKANFCTLLTKDKKDNIQVSFVLNDGKEVESLDENSRLAQDILEHGRSDIIVDVGQSIYADEFKEISTLIFAPVLIKDELLGSIIMGSSQELNYTSGDLKLLSAIAFLVGISIENTKLYNRLEDTFFQTIRALSETVEKRDTYTGGHVQRVMEYCVITGSELEFSKERILKLKLAALMHDIGKVGIRDEILGKSEGLTDDEYEKMKMHTIYGAEIMEKVEHLKDVVPGVRGHHERFDGKGYPDGLKGNEIPLEARIISVADTFDSMITDRPYRKGLTVKQALDELVKYSDSQFDRQVVDVFIRGMKREGKIKGGV